MVKTTTSVRVDIDQLSMARANGLTNFSEYINNCLKAYNNQEEETTETRRYKLKEELERVQQEKSRIVASIMELDTLDEKKEDENIKQQIERARFAQHSWKANNPKRFG